MIKSIRLVNWRSHSDSKLEFRKGTNLLVGIMGAGKSSILEGLSFALFGTFPAIERRKLKLENIVRLSEQESKVVLEFDWDSSDYRIERTIERSKKGSSTHAEIYKNGSLIENGSMAVNTYIGQLTGVDYDLFTRAIYSEQNNIDHFLNLDPKKRKEELDRLLGLDRFETARANIVSVINRLNSKRKILEERFSKERLDALRVREKSLSDDKNSAENELKEADSVISGISGRYSSSLTSYEEMKKSKEAHDRLVKEETRLAALHQALSKEIEGKPSDGSIKLLEERLIDLGKNRAVVLASTRSLDEKNATLSKDLGSIDAKIRAAAEAQKRMAAAETELKAILRESTIEGLSLAQKELEHSLLSCESEKKSLEREIAEISETIGKLHSGLSKCPICSSTLDEEGINHVRGEKDSLVKAKNARVAELSETARNKKKENEQLVSSIRKASLLRENMSSFSELLKGTQDLPQMKLEAQESIAALAEEKKSCSTKLEAFSSEAEKLHVELSHMRLLSEKRKKAAETEKNLADIRSSMESIKFDEKAFEEARTSLEKLKLENEQLLSKRKHAETRMRFSADLLKTVTTELIAMEMMGKDIGELCSLEEQLSIYRNALLETQTGLRSDLTESINSAMNELWAIFYPYKNYHGLRLFVSDKDYVFEVNDGGAWKNLETIASGGERASAALALRVALAMILTPKLSWLILDEPTHNLDTEAVELLSSALQFKVPEVVKQTFVITHDEAFMGSDFAASYRLMRDKNRNGETKVEPM